MALATALRRLTIGLGAVCLGLAPALAEPMKIQISTPAVPGDWHAEMLNVFKQEVEAAYPEKFAVEIYLSASLFAQGTETTAMQRGNLQMGLPSAQDFVNQVPAWSIFTAGYLIRDPEHQQKVFDSDVGAEMTQMIEDQMGLKLLAIAYLGTRQLNLREVRDVETPEDLRGVKLRMPGAETWQFLGRALGADPLPLAFGEVYLALQTGTIDGQDNPLPTDRAAKFYEVTEQLVMTGHLVDGVYIAIAKPVWDGLSADEQAVFQKAADAAAAFNNEGRIKDEAALVQFFKDQGMTITEPDRDAFREHVQAEYLASDLSKDWPVGMVDRINAIE